MSKTGIVTIHLDDLEESTLKALHEDLKKHQRLSLYKDLVEEIRTALQRKRRQS